jgi:hypothetical protein
MKDFTSGKEPLSPLSTSPPVHKTKTQQRQLRLVAFSLQPDRKWRTKLGNPSNSESAGVEGLNRAHTHSRLRRPAGRTLFYFVTCC